MRFFFARRVCDSLGVPALWLAAMLMLVGPVTPTSATENAAAGPAHADTSPQNDALVHGDPVSSGDDTDQPPTLASLLDALAESEDGEAADELSRQIQNLWNQSGSEAVDLLMVRASVAMRARNYTMALDLLDTVIALEPDYAEGWNRRATVHFLREDYALSIADVEQVLRLEPRHFGALSGIGFILEELGQDRQAQLFLSEALRVHPHMSRTREVLGAIERRLRGAPI